MSALVLGNNETSSWAGARNRQLEIYRDVDSAGCSRDTIGEVKAQKDKSESVFKDPAALLG